MKKPGKTERLKTDFDQLWLQGAGGQVTARMLDGEDAAYAIALADEVRRRYGGARMSRKPYYEDTTSGITIYHGDCRDVLPTLERVDHVITDPPYSETTHEGARSLQSDIRFGGSGANDGRIDFAAVGPEFVRWALQAANPARWTVATVDWRHVHHLEDCPPEGQRFVRFGIWVKPDGAPQFTGDRPATGWEAVAILHAEGGRMRWNRGGHHAVWTYNVARGEHPTEKPLALLRDFVTAFTDPGDLILDPFMGSGTTLVAAQLEGRRAIGIELEERWCEAAANRLRYGTKGAARVATGQLPMRVLV